MAIPAHSTIAFASPQEEARPERPSRRGLIGTLITAPIAGASVGAALKKPEDPVFALIEAELAARKARDTTEEDRDYAHWSDVYDAVFRGRPTTTAGLIAMLAVFYDREVNEFDSMPISTGESLKLILDAGRGLMDAQGARS